MATSSRPWRRQGALPPLRLDVALKRLASRTGGSGGGTRKEKAPKLRHAVAIVAAHARPKKTHRLGSL